MTTSPNATATRAPKNGVPQSCVAGRGGGARPATSSRKNDRSELAAAHAKVLRRRRITVVLTVVTLITGGTAAFTSLVWPGFAIAEPVETPTVAASVRQQRLRFAPEQRIGEQTALVGAVPDMAGIWVQHGISAYLGWQMDDAVEAWNIQFWDGTPLLGQKVVVYDDDDGSYSSTTSQPQITSPLAADSQVTALEATDSSVANRADAANEVNPAARIYLTIGQWATPKEASAFLTAQTKELGDPLLTGELALATQAGTDETNGKYLIFEGLSEVEAAMVGAAGGITGTQAAGAGTAAGAATAGVAGGQVRAGALADDEQFGDLPTTLGVMWWRNGTVVVKAIGPINLLAEFYSAFPL